MLEFTTTILQFAEQGEKTGWTYIEIPFDIAQQLKPGNKKSFRVKGMLDNYAFSGVALLPIGDGKFIMALNAEVRKAIRKNKGAMLHVSIEADNEYVLQMPDYLAECFEDEPQALAFFNELPKSHRDYFIKWIESAKTEPTKVRRITQTINGLAMGLDFGAMIRMYQGNRDRK